MTSPPNQNRKTKQQRRAKPLPEDTSSLTWARERGEGNEVRHPPFSTCTLSLQAIIGPKASPQRTFQSLDTNFCTIGKPSKDLSVAGYKFLHYRQALKGPFSYRLQISPLLASPQRTFQLLATNFSTIGKPQRTFQLPATNFSTIGKPSKDLSVAGYKFLHYRQALKDLSVTGYKFLHYRQALKGPFSYRLQISPL
ncbi:hypothetical protein TNIN_457171 [Trichonephila inaurata madagascariensis]|uniref:Uncharacterized protein n=1 Tax=Trichonephila inaurata madagascariensis TaxID=2747483 RepID=A0A8X6ITN6_9ARAC|nr:hypothetical protein TNIN_457171 [Trichonephila inaurata madagascariensis]